MGLFGYSVDELCHACHNQDYDKIKKILDKKKEFANELREDGYSIFCIVAQNGDLQMMELFLNAGANPNKAGTDGRTPLIYATANGKVTAVDLLLRSGALPNKGDSKNSTPLMYAVSSATRVLSSDQEKVIGSLLRSGANINAKDDFGRYVIDWCDTIPIKELIRKNGGRNY
jgi:ankyrin repeat protein